MDNTIVEIKEQTVQTKDMNWNVVYREMFAVIVYTEVCGQRVDGFILDRFSTLKEAEKEKRKYIREN